jgi:DNA replication protein DnaC
MKEKEKPSLVSLGILPIWHDKSWDDFTNDERAREVIVTYSKKLEAAEKDCVGYFIYGLPGVGKSMLANILFKDLVDKSKRVKVISLGGLVDLFTASWSDSDKREDFRYLVQVVDYLCIEDFGKEFYRKDGDGKSFATTILEDVLVKRLGFRKITFIVSSIGAGEVSKIYSKNLASLVLETCVPLQVVGKDFRTKIQARLKGKWQPDKEKLQ